VCVVAIVVLAVLGAVGRIEAKRKQRHRNVPESMIESKAVLDDVETRALPDERNQTENEIEVGDENENECKKSERDCKGVCFGTAVEDQCGTCGGNNEACTDCKGVVNGDHVPDRSGTCCKRSQVDCHGDCMGMAQRDDSRQCCYANQMDDCGVCFGNNACLDCNNDAHGTAFRDGCNVCSEGNTGHRANADKDCAGVCFGEARPDDCNVCSGGTTNHEANSNKDCLGVCFGPTLRDKCGDCGGDGSRCKDCSGVENGDAVEDMCGVCSGDNSTCCGPYGNCNNRGDCAPEDGGACMCDLGWGGKFCTRKQPMCKWQDCGEHGRCDPDTGACMCDPGFIGEHCECSRCSGHGWPDPSNACSCTCRVGYTGPDCSTCSAPDIHNYAYVCVSKHGEDINNRRIDEKSSRELGFPVLMPMRFMLVAVPKVDVQDVLINNHPLTHAPHKFALLPGTSINQTVYGCNCLPADPIDQHGSFMTRDFGEAASEDDQQQQSMLQKTDAVAIRNYMMRNPMSKNDDALVETLETTIVRFKRFVTTRALTLVQCEGFLQEVFDFWNIDVDVATGTPETVGSGVDQMKSTATYERVTCIVYFIVACGLLILFLVFSIVAVLVITGGTIAGTPVIMSSSAPSLEEAGAF